MIDIDTLRERLEKIDDPVQLLECLFAHAPIAFQIFDASGRSVLVNQAFLDMFGVEPPPEYTVLDDEIARERGVLELVHRAFRGETVHTPPMWYDPGELQQVHVTGARRVGMQATLFPIVGRTGHVHHVAAAIKDVSAELIAREEHDRSQRLVEQLKRVEAELRESQQFLETTQRVAGLGTWISAPPTGHTLKWSAETDRIFGLVPGEFDERLETFFAMVHPADREAVRRAAAAAIQHDTPYAMDHRVVRPDGSVAWVHEEAVVERDDQGRPLRMIGTVLDITERRRVEEQFMQAQKMEAVGRLAGGVAHDFNNMLTAILGFTGLIGNQLAPGDPVHDDLREITTAAERASLLTRQLLAFSRKQVIQPRVLDLAHELRGLRRMLERVVGEATTLEWRLAPGVGRVIADPAQVEQIVLNFVLNARDALAGSGTITIAVANVDIEVASADQQTGVPPGAYVLMSVADTGAGMAPAVRERVFEPFFTTKTRGEGTGLGLSAVYGIVKQSGGHILVESEPGVGTVFKVFLPRTNEPSQSPAPETVHDPVWAGSETILLVEDEPAVRVFVHRALREQGYDVLVAQDGVAALELVERHRTAIDLVLTDVVMPRLGGPQLVERLLAQRPDLRVMFMSGYTEDTVLRQAIQRRQTAFLAKPLSYATLVQKVRELLDEK